MGALSIDRGRHRALPRPPSSDPGAFSAASTGWLWRPSTVSSSQAFAAALSPRPNRGVARFALVARAPCYGRARRAPSNAATKGSDR